jgi:hypothetical protein
MCHPLLSSHAVLLLAPAAVMRCLQERNGDAASCQYLYEQLQACQMNAQQFS